MKTILLFLISILPLAALCQPIDHFANPDSRWHVATIYPNGSIDDPSFIQTTTRIYGFSGDTLIDGQDWLRMVSTADADFADGFLFEAFVRSEGDIVLAYRYAQGVDTLYDFSMEIGDSLNYDFEFTSAGLLLEQTSEVELLGASYGLFEFGEPIFGFFYIDEVWIKGIGSLHGPLFPLEPRIFLEELPDSLVLTCAGVGIEQTYTDPRFENCYRQIVMGLAQREAPGFQIMPNPASDRVVVHVPEFQPFTLRLFSAHGSVVLNAEVYSDRYHLDVSHLPKGLYIVEVAMEGAVQSQKWLKE